MRLHKNQSRKMLCQRSSKAVTKKTDESFYYSNNQEVIYLIRPDR